MSAGATIASDHPSRLNARVMPRMLSHDTMGAGDRVRSFVRNTDVSGRGLFGRKSQSLSTCQPHFGRERGALWWVLVHFLNDITAARRGTFHDTRSSHSPGAIQQPERVPITYICRCRATMSRPTNACTARRPAQRKPEGPRHASHITRSSALAFPIPMRRLTGLRTYPPYQPSADV